MKSITSYALLSTALLSTLNSNGVLAIETLGQTIVSANRVEQSQTDYTGDITVITNEQLQEKAIQTLPEALERLAGIPMSANGGLGSMTNIFLRGHDSKRLLLLVDGVRFNDPTSLNGANWQHLLVSDIKRIEILPGAQAGIWGADAGAGVINVITQETTQGTHGHMSYALGSLGEKQTNAAISYGDHRFDARISRQSLSADSFSSVTPVNQNPLDYEKDGYRNDTTNIKLGWKIAKTQRLELSGFFTDATSAYDRYQQPNDPQTTGSFSQNMGNLSYALDLLDWHTKFSTQQGRMHREAFDSVGGLWNGTFDVDLQQNTVITNRDDTLGNWTLGAESIHQQANNMGTGPQQGSYDQLGSFIYRVQKFYLPHSTLPTIANMGLRNDDHNQYRSYTSKYLGVKQFWASQGYVSVNIGDSQRTPNAYERFGPYTSQGIQPETINSQAMTVGWKGYSLTRFEDRVNNLIDYSYPQGYTNVVGESSLSGWEWKATTSITSLASELSFSYTQLTAKDKNGHTLVRRPENMGNIDVSYLGIANTILSLQTQYTGSRLDGGYQGPQTGNFWLWHANANYQFNKQTRVFVKGINLTDERIMQATDSYNGSVATTYYAYSPRTLLTGVEWKF